MLRYAIIAEDRVARALDQVLLERGIVFIGAC